MTDPNDERLPPLGERTPARPRGSGPGAPWYRRAWVAGLAGIGLGLVLGVALATFTDTGPERAEVGTDGPAGATIPLRTTTTVAALPRDCSEAIRTAEQSLALLDQAFQTARRFDVRELDRMLSDLQQVRQSLTERVRACVESG